MTDIPAGEFRDNVSSELRRVERGERLRVTVSGRPVAQLLPLPAATAIANDLAVASQDGDYDDIPGLRVIRV